MANTFYRIRMRSRFSGQIIEDVLPAGSQGEATAMAKARYPGWGLYNPPQRVTNPKQGTDYSPFRDKK